jgi:hypothetical protein
MHFLIPENGIRTASTKIKCDDVDPMQLLDIQDLIESELQPPE